MIAVANEIENWELVDMGTRFDKSVLKAIKFDSLFDSYGGTVRERCKSTPHPLPSRRMWSQQQNTKTSKMEKKRT